MLNYSIILSLCLFHFLISLSMKNHFLLSCVSSFWWKIDQWQQDLLYLLYPFGSSSFHTFDYSAIILFLGWKLDEIQGNENTTTRSRKYFTFQIFVLTDNLVLSRNFAFQSLNNQSLLKKHHKFVAVVGLVLKSYFWKRGQWAMIFFCFSTWLFLESTLYCLTVFGYFLNVGLLCLYLFVSLSLHTTMTLDKFFVGNSSFHIGIDYLFCRTKTVSGHYVIIPW